MPFSFTDGAAVDGTTVMSSAREAQWKADIETFLGALGIDSGALGDGIVTRAKLAAGNKEVTQAISIHMVSDVILTTRLGFQQGATAVEYFGFTAKVNGTIVAVDYSAEQISGQTCRFEIGVAGTANGTSRSDMVVSVTPSTTAITSLSIAVTSGQRIGCFVNGQGGGNTDVVGGFATVYFQRALA